MLESYLLFEIYLSNTPEKQFNQWNILGKVIGVIFENREIDLNVGYDIMKKSLINGHSWAISSDLSV